MKKTITPLQLKLTSTILIILVVVLVVMTGLYYKQIYRSAFVDEKVKTHQVAIQNAVDARFQDLIIVLEYLAAQAELDDPFTEPFSDKHGSTKLLLFQKPSISYISLGPEEHLLETTIGAEFSFNGQLKRGDLGDSYSQNSFTAFFSEVYNCPSLIKQNKSCRMIVIPIYQTDQRQQIYLSTFVDTTKVIKAVLDEFKAKPNPFLELSYRNKKDDASFKATVKLLDNRRAYYLTPSYPTTKHPIKLVIFAIVLVTTILVFLIYMLLLRVAVSQKDGQLKELNFQFTESQSQLNMQKVMFELVGVHSDSVIWIFNASERKFEYVGEKYKDFFYQDKAKVMTDYAQWLAPIEEGQREHLDKVFSVFRFADDSQHEVTTSFTVNVKGHVPMRLQDQSYCVAGDQGQPHYIVGIVTKL